MAAALDAAATACYAASDVFGGYERLRRTRPDRSRNLRRPQRFDVSRRAAGGWGDQRQRSAMFAGVRVGDAAEGAAE